MSLYPQMALALSLEHQPSLDNFIVGSDNSAQTLAALQAMVQGEMSALCLYVWGSCGSGKTHLIQSLASAQRTCVLDEARLSTSVEAKEHRWFLVDDVDDLSARAQINLFHLYNDLRAKPLEEQYHLVVTASCAPMFLAADYLPDLRTRLGWDGVYQLDVLTDDAKARVLANQARQLGLSMHESVIRYLLTHTSRNLAQLHQFLIQLDGYSLQKKQAITLPLVKEWLAHYQ